MKYKIGDIVYRYSRSFEYDIDSLEVIGTYKSILWVYDRSDSNFTFSIEEDEVFSSEEEVKEDLKRKLLEDKIGIDYRINNLREEKLKQLGFKEPSEDQKEANLQYNLQCIEMDKRNE